jgi:hypothetical protein
MKYSTGNLGDLNVALALQEGVFVELSDTVADATVSGFICHLLDVSNEIIAAEIKTIMLNNQVVDKPGTTKICGGDTLTLSGAMPGLVGAMLRSDSPIGVMRSGITAGADNRRDRENTGTWSSIYIRVKLFNLVLKNYRDRIVAYGFYLEDSSR